MERTAHLALIRRDQAAVVGWPSTAPFDVDVVGAGQAGVAAGGGEAAKAAAAAAAAQGVAARPADGQEDDQQDGVQGQRQFDGQRPVLVAHQLLDQRRRLAVSAAFAKKNAKEKLQNKQKKKQGAFVFKFRLKRAPPPQKKKVPRV